MRLFNLDLVNRKAKIILDDYKCRSKEFSFCIDRIESIVYQNIYGDDRVIVNYDDSYGNGGISLIMDASKTRYDDNGVDYEKKFKNFKEFMHFLIDKTL